MSGSEPTSRIGSQLFVQVIVEKSDCDFVCREYGDTIEEALGRVEQRLEEQQEIITGEVYREAKEWIENARREYAPTIHLGCRRCGQDNPCTCPTVFIHSAAPSLTLANGTVVRAGDVLVVADRKDPLVVKVTGVGEGDFLFKFLASSPGGRPVNGREAAASDYPNWDWSHWSEVYPDRPVPGGEE
jgi:hypothetical protein